MVIITLLGYHTTGDHAINQTKGVVPVIFQSLKTKSRAALTNSADPR